MRRREIEWLAPVEAAERLGHLPGLAFLDSALEHRTLGRWSYLGVDPFGVLTATEAGAAWNAAAVAGHPAVVLKSLLDRFRLPTEDGLPPFQTGAMGAIGYEFGRAFERLPAVAGARSTDEVLRLGFYDVVIAFDHLERRAVAMSSGFPEDDGARRQARAEARLDAILAALAVERPATAPPPPPAGEWRSNFSRADYLAAVERVREYIRAGDIYQANIAQRFEIALPAGYSPWGFYRRLRQMNAATFAAYLDLGGRVVASSSPERFVRLSPEGVVEARPIKGTIRRANHPIVDRLLADRLLDSEKDQAENVMIVDLLRNDLSRVCRPHSVEVPVLCGLETYAGVHHLVSTVTGRLREGLGATDLIAAAFPGGSITGAPKIRAMEIIGELERRPRGFYCGSIGWIGCDGAMDLNIAIRTAVFEGGSASFHVGGGITVLSDPAAEHEETLVKAARIFDAFAAEAAVAAAE